jgi:prepilin-type processing-associated H-X9-DG protein
MWRKPEWLTRVAEACAFGVVAVILVAAVHPLTSAGRQYSDAQVCAENERRIGRALMMYVDDYDGNFPPNRGPSFNTNWKDSIARYVKVPPGGRVQDVYTCPVNIARAAKDDSGRWPISYGYNSAIGYALSVQHNTTVPLNAIDIKDPSGFILLLETRYNAPDLGPWMIDGNASPDGSGGDPSLKWYNLNPRTNKGQFQHHRKRMNVVTFDGHVAAVTLPRTVAVPQMWNPWLAPNAYVSKLTGMVAEYK